MEPRKIPPLGHARDAHATSLETWTLNSLPVYHTTTTSSLELPRLDLTSTALRRPAQVHVFGRDSLKDGSTQVSAQPSDQLQQLAPLIVHSRLTEPSVIPYPSPFPSSAPPTTSSNHSILAHPLFEELTRAIYFGRQIGEDPEKQRLLDEQHKKTMDRIIRARMDAQSRRNPNSPNPELDFVLRKYLELLQGLNQELTITQNEANSACAMFEQQIRAITTRAQQRDGPVALSSSDEDHVKKALKRKFGDQIRGLSDEFHRKTKKGKLPVNATDVLRGWWDTNLVWPYPSEDEKHALAARTNLDAIQINNWFINQRKRHWHKFFKDGRLPQSPEEAIDILRSQGVIP